MIDGEIPDGGSQMLGMSLALSMVTQTPFRMENIRFGKSGRGLFRSELATIKAAEQICTGTAEHEGLDSRQVTFRPQAVKEGHYSFSLGAAASTTDLLNCLLAPLMLKGGRTRFY